MRYYLFICVILNFACLGLISGSKTSEFANGHEQEFVVADAFDVEVTGSDFQWDFRYPGPDGRLHTPDDQTSSRILHLPSHRIVRLFITSTDYVYIFGIPQPSVVRQTKKVREPHFGKKKGTSTEPIHPSLRLGNRKKKLRQIAVPAMSHLLEFRCGEEATLDLKVDPMCGFRFLHDPLMGQIVISDDRNYQGLLPECNLEH